MASLSLLTTIVSGPTRDIKAFFLWRPNPLRGTIMRESTIMQETTTEALQIQREHAGEHGGSGSLLPAPGSCSRPREQPAAQQKESVMVMQVRGG